MAERLITLNIRRYLVKQPRPKRARRAMRYIRERIAHYTKMEPENVKIGYDVNNAVFKYYAKYMTPIKLRVLIGTDTADVLLFKENADKSQSTKVKAENTKAENKIDNTNDNKESKKEEKEKKKVTKNSIKETANNKK
ncbi:MAG: hypothetical protein ACP5UN_01430 [Candidatus Micrarchaeia archaeon]